MQNIKLSTSIFRINAQRGGTHVCNHAFITKRKDSYALINTLARLFMINRTRVLYLLTSVLMYNMSSTLKTKWCFFLRHSNGEYHRLYLHELNDRC